MGGRSQRPRWARYPLTIAFGIMLGGAVVPALAAQLSGRGDEVDDVVCDAGEIRRYDHIDYGRLTPGGPTTPAAAVAAYAADHPAGLGQGARRTAGGATWARYVKRDDGRPVVVVMAEDLGEGWRVTSVTSCEAVGAGQ